MNRGYDIVETGKRINFARVARNLSLFDLAKSISCTPDHLDRAEKGKRGLSIDLLFLVAIELRVSMNYLTNCPVNDNESLDQLYCKQKLTVIREEIDKLICADYVGGLNQNE